MDRHALWASTAARGGMSTFVTTMQDTDLWRDWKIRQVTTHTNGTAITRIVKFATGLAAFVGEIVFRRPAVVHLHSAAYGSFVRKGILTWLSKVFAVPVVLHMHGADFHLFVAGSSTMSNWLIRRTLERADAVIALGDAWADTLRAIAPGANIVVVPNAVKPGTAVRHHAEGPVRVLFLGEIGDRKGTFTLLRAWAKMRAANLETQQAVLTIAGDGEAQRARDLVCALKIGESVTVRDWMSTSGVADELSRSQILVLPSRDEGQPMAILEAMARGLCVIASDVGGIPELLSDDCGILVRPDDEEELASALGGMISNLDARRSLGRAAFNRITETFDVDVVSRRFDTLYTKIIGTRS